MDPLPPCHVHKSADFVRFICFSGTPSPHLLRTSYMEAPKVIPPVIKFLQVKLSQNISSNSGIGDRLLFCSATKLLEEGYTYKWARLVSGAACSSTNSRSRRTSYSASRLQGPRFCPMKIDLTIGHFC